MVVPPSSPLRSGPPDSLSTLMRFVSNATGLAPRVEEAAAAAAAEAAAAAAASTAAAGVGGGIQGFWGVAPRALMGWLPDLSSRWGRPPPPAAGASSAPCIGGATGSPSSSTPPATAASSAPACRAVTPPGPATPLLPPPSEEEAPAASIAASPLAGSHWSLPLPALRSRVWGRGRDFEFDPWLLAAALILLARVGQGAAERAGLRDAAEAARAAVTMGTAAVAALRGGILRLLACGGRRKQKSE